MDALWMILKALFIGAVEGITEFLPISSTGHLLLVQHVLGETQSDFFNVVIQVGAVMAVIPLFWNRFVFMSNLKDPAGRDLLIKILVAFGITGVGGLLLKKLGLELPETVLPIAWALLVGGVAFLWIENRLEGKKLSEELSWTVVIAAGLAQILAAAFPGASRSGSTILIMLMLGLSRGRATEFSFLIGIPTMIAAGSYEGYKELSSGISVDWPFLLWSALFSAIFAFISVKWLLGFIQNNSFKVFGYYRIGLGVFLIAGAYLGWWV